MAHLDDPVYDRSLAISQLAGDETLFSAIAAVFVAECEGYCAALEAALAKGERRVTFGDKTVEYRTVEELQAAIDAVKRDLHDQAVARGLWPKAPRQIRVTTSKGF